MKHTIAFLILLISSTALAQPGGRLGWWTPDGANDIATRGDKGIKIQSDSNGVTLGAGDDYTFAWDGSNAVHTLTAGDFRITGGGVVVDDGEYFGSASDLDAIQIEADGDVVLTQDLVAAGNLFGKYGYFGTADTQYGGIIAYGHATGHPDGGQIYLETAADYDTTIGWYSISVDEDDLVIMQGITEKAKLLADGNWDFQDADITTTGDVSAATIIATDLADNEIPRHVNDSTGLAASGITSDLTDITFQPTTDGDIEFKDADGGTPVMHLDMINERVGIGTASPSKKLQVNGSIALQNDEYIANNINGKFFFHTEGGTFAEGYFVRMAIGGSYQPTLPANGLYVQGNVGFGDTTPDAKLDVTSTGDTEVFVDSGGVNNYAEIELRQNSTTTDRSYVRKYAENHGSYPDALIAANVVSNTTVGFFGVDQDGDFVLSGKNVLVGTSSTDGVATKAIAISTGTAASVGQTDQAILQSADAQGIAGAATLHLRGERDAAAKTVIGFGTESANAETPTAGNWTPGDIVEFTDTGDASGNGTYQLKADGSTWGQLY